MYLFALQLPKDNILQLLTFCIRELYLDNYI